MPTYSLTLRQAKGSRLTFTELDNNFLYLQSLSLNGATGPAGVTGSTGPVGSTGSTGPIGVTGSTGATGPQGEIGATGPQGDPGPQGATGPIGVTGPEGPIGVTGPEGPIGVTGPEGPIGVTGPQGEIGATGPQGEIGATGPQGDPGPQGATGSGLIGKRYIATLGQTGSNAPYPVTLFKDDFGDITFSYYSTGYYRIFSTSGFVPGRTFINGINPWLTNNYPISGGSSFRTGKDSVSFGGGPASIIFMVPTGYNRLDSGVTYIDIATWYNGTGADDVLDKYNGYIEIVMYP